MTERPDQPDEHSEDATSPEEARTIKDSREMLSGGQKDPMIGLTVGQYTIKRVIGSGGMGTVYEAMQQSPRRTVALKMLKQGIASRSALRRFEYEAQTLGRLRHEHIAQIHEAGTWDDGTGARPFFAMEYLVGAKSLTQYARDKKLSTRDRLELFLKVCDAVQHGHQKGIIHRDLKPPNILVTSSGVPKIIDFGVARSTDSDMAVTTLQTDVGALIGTLQYMSPEQCAADPNDIDTRSDVYALGVVLFELLCEDLPYDVTKVALHEAARIVQEEEPTRPSTVDKRLRGDVEIIALKALQKDRDRRYQSAVELEQDVIRYLAGDPIIARGPGVTYQVSKWISRHRYGVGMIVLLLTVAMGFVFSIGFINRGWLVSSEQEKLKVPFITESIGIHQVLTQLLVDSVVSTLPHDLEQVAANEMFLDLYKEAWEHAQTSNYIFGDLEQMGMKAPVMEPGLDIPSDEDVPTPSVIWALMQDSYDPDTRITDEAAIRLAATLAATSNGKLFHYNFSTDPSWPRGFANLKHHLQMGCDYPVDDWTLSRLEHAGYLNPYWLDEDHSALITARGQLEILTPRVAVEQTETGDAANGRLLELIIDRRSDSEIWLAIAITDFVLDSEETTRTLDVPFAWAAARWAMFIAGSIVMLMMALFITTIIMGIRIMAVPWRAICIVAALSLPALAVVICIGDFAFMRHLEKSGAGDHFAWGIAGYWLKELGFLTLVLFTITFIITTSIMAYCDRCRFNSLLARCIYYPMGLAVIACVMLLGSGWFEVFWTEVMEQNLGDPTFTNYQ